METESPSFKRQFRRIFFGKARNPLEPDAFHKLSLIAFLAWIGLGSDGISSSCYGPQEAFLALHGHYYLGIFLAGMTALTVFIISASYMQIIDLFPAGGGGYVVASKLLTPKLGMISGCALIVDYVLTITISSASCADALFSFLPLGWQSHKIIFTIAVIVILIIMNSRGVKESVMPLVPIFLIFMITHVVLILYVIFTHIPNLPFIVKQASEEFRVSRSQIGTSGVLFILLYAYSVGGGTYTGIEAVSNALPILREPKAKTGKRTMIYMAVSLAVMAGGLILAYLFYQVEYQEGKTLNAVLFQKVSQSWIGGSIFVMITLISEALILAVAAQTGFLDGPRVLANMATDEWMPSKFAILSDRLVTENGILLMGLSSIALVLISKGSVSFLVVLYSINVFITFTLSQLGMVRHWWKARKNSQNWIPKLAVNGIGFVLSATVLVIVSIMKFNEGGWLTFIITSSLVAIALLIKRHYNRTRELLKETESLRNAALEEIEGFTGEEEKPSNWEENSENHTAIILVSGFNGLGLHALFAAMRTFQEHFKNFIFVQAGVIDASKFKGIDEMDNLRQDIEANLSKYVKLMKIYGFYAEYHYSLGTDVVDEVEKIVKDVIKRFPQSMVFAGQLVFPNETLVTRLLHNYTSFSIHRRLYYEGIPVLVLPVRVGR
jgi:amino acid transporter